jgi:hypothetical protein
MNFRLFQIQADLLLRSRPLHLAVAIASIGILGGCSKDSITVTTVPKERVNTAYQVPDHWTLKPASGMRAASFSVRDEHGHDGEVSVLPMPRLNIADIEIVNLWRQQVGLEPATEDQVTELAQTVKIGNQDGNLFDLASPDATDDPDHAARIVTAYLHSEEITWFFKLTGPSHFVEVEKPAFTQFLATVNLAKMHSEFQSRAAAQRPAAAPRAPAQELPQWTVPEGWQAGTPSSSMLLASFSISDQTDGPAEVTVSAFGGAAGGRLMNINRWRGQVGLGDLSEDDLATVIQSIDLNGIEGTLVDMDGPETRIVAAMVTVGPKTWFYKMMGAPGTIETQIEAFTAFVQSVRYSGNG